MNESVKKPLSLWLIASFFVVLIPLFIMSVVIRPDLALAYAQPLRLMYNPFTPKLTVYVRVLGVLTLVWTGCVVSSVGLLLLRRWAVRLLEALSCCFVTYFFVNAIALLTEMQDWQSVLIGVLLFVVVPCTPFALVLVWSHRKQIRALFSG